MTLSHDPHLDNKEFILSARNLSREVDGKLLVDNISLDVRTGSIIAIVGPSGAGKSSFLRLLNRLDEPTQGTVFLDGQDYRTLPPTALRRRVGMLMQAPYLFAGTVAQNIRFGPQQQGKTLSTKDIEDLLDKVGLAGFSERDINNLSGGEAQRVSLARTLANKPQVLLLDEPTSALDEASKRDVETLVAEIVAQDALTCLLVTHDVGQAKRLAGHVMVMKSGHQTAVGPVKEVLGA